MKKTMRGVFERPVGSGVWWINYYDADGKRHREKIGKQTVAENAYLFRRNQVREGKFQPPRVKATLTFQVLAELALADKKLRVAPSSLRSDEDRIVPVNAVFGDLAVEKVTTGAIETFLGGLREKGLTPATANRYRALISSVFSFGVRSGKIAHNPVTRVRQFREADHRIRFLTQDEEARLRQVLAKGPDAEEHLAQVDLSLHTGMRRGEQKGLKWENVDLDRRILTVTGKTGRRFIPINQVAREALLTLHPISNGSEFVADYVNWVNWFREACQKAGIANFRWHDLRHTFASRLVMAGVDLYTVQKLLGHKSMLTTQRYAHLSSGHQQAAVERLEVPGANGHQNGTTPSDADAAVRQLVVN